MDYKKLVGSLEKMLPPKISYGELVGAPWPYTGQGEMVYEDPESYFIEQAITAINDLLARAESAESRAEKAERERDAALTALYPTPSGGPLPIEQLEKMTGLPVFLYIFDYENHNCWQIIEKIENGKIFFKGIGRLYVPISELGEKYNLYAHHAARINQNYTNADKIRSMTDEELARAMDMVCPPDTACNDGQQCIKCWIDWLKQPAKED